MSFMYRDRRVECTTVNVFVCASVFWLVFWSSFLDSIKKHRVVYCFTLLDGTNETDPKGYNDRFVSHVFRAR